MAGNHARLEMAGQAENVGLARLVAAAFAAQMEFSLSEIEEIKMAVAEAVNNAIIHGYRGGGGRVWLTLEQKEKRLRIVVEDEGVGFGGDDGQEKQEGEGLGLMFMRSFMDEVHIESGPEKGCRVIMLLWADRGKRSQAGAGGNA